MYIISYSWSLGSVVSYSGRIGCNGQNAFSLESHLSNAKEGSSDSIPEGIKEKQRSFSGIYDF